MTDHIQVITTTETEEDARRIALALVEGRLAACVQVLGPIASTYRWQGKIETAAEWQCVAKTRWLICSLGSRRPSSACTRTKCPRSSPCPSWPKCRLRPWLDEQVDA